MNTLHTNLAVGGGGDDDVADVEGAGLHQQAGDGATAVVKVGLDDGAARWPVRICRQLLHLRLQQDRLQKVVHPLPELGADLRRRDEVGTLVDTLVELL